MTVLDQSVFYQGGFRPDMDSTKVLLIRMDSITAVLDPDAYYY